MRRRPPPSATISIRRAPASSAFSTSSLATLAGRSTTSPAAMRLTTLSVSWRTGMQAPLVSRVGRRDFTSIVRGRLFAARALAPRLPLLRPRPLARSARGRAGRPARYGRRRRAPDQLDQALARIEAILRLGAVALRRDPQHALGGHSLSGEP